MAAARHVLTILAVADVARSARFYREAFGWPVVVEVPPYVEFEMPGGLRFGVYDRAGFARNTTVLPDPIRADSIGPGELYFHVDDVPAALADLERAGARVLSAPAARPWGDEAATWPIPMVTCSSSPDRSAPDRKLETRHAACQFDRRQGVAVRPRSGIGSSGRPRDTYRAARRQWHRGCLAHRWRHG